MKHKRTQAIIVKILNEEGELTTGEIYDRLVNYQARSSKRTRKNTSINVTMNSLCQILKRKDFRKAGFVERDYRKGIKAQVLWATKEEC